MPHYFFHLNGAPDRLDDPEGQDFASLEAAQEYARKSARELLADGIVAGQDRSACTFEIKDIAGRTLAIVPVTATVRGG
jgi:hypothetical protein